MIGLAGEENVRTLVLTGQETPGHLTDYAHNNYAREQITGITTQTQAQTLGEPPQKRLKLPAMTAMTITVMENGIMTQWTGDLQEIFHLMGKAIAQ
jgi:hypothetical protein